MPGLLNTARPAPVELIDVRGMDSLGVPYAVHAADGGFVHVSETARRVLGDPADPHNRPWWERAARLIQAREERVTFRPGGPPVVIPMSASCAMSLQRLDDARGRSATFVVFQPTRVAAASRDLSVYGLTDREREVAELVAAGRATKAIAAELGISFHTARHHKERVFAKLGARCRVEVAQCVLGTN